MNGNLQKIFKNIPELEPSKGLERLILKRIALRQKLSLRRKLFTLYAGFATTLGVFVWAIFILGKAVIQSDFWTLAQLFFSDTGLVLKNWSDFAYSLMETLPIFGIVAMLVPIFILFMLASEYFKTVNNNHYKYI